MRHITSGGTHGVRHTRREPSLARAALLCLGIALALSMLGCSHDWDRDRSSADAAADAADPEDAAHGPDASSVSPDGGSLDSGISRDSSVADTGASMLDASPAMDATGLVTSEAGSDASTLPDTSTQDAGVDSAAPPSCPANHGCPAAFPCMANSAGYTCRGQLADWPLPMRKAGQSAAMQQYTVTATTLLDQVTGLMWERLETTTELSFDQATQYCDGLALEGHDDFRVPTHIEMATWLGSEPAPEYDAALLGTFWDGQHWTSSPDRNDPSLRWNIYLANGTIWSIPTNPVPTETNPKAELHLVRCVRTHELRYAGTNANRLSANAGVVLDRATGLSWQQSVQSAQSDILYSAADAHCAALELDGKSDWRLPGILELLTTVDLAQTGPNALVSPLLGPTSSGDCYWASTLSAFSQAKDMREERFIMSPNGDSFSYQLTLPDSNCAARCVRK